MLRFPIFTDSASSPPSLFSDFLSVLRILLGIFFLVLYKSQKEKVTLKGNSLGAEFTSSRLPDVALYQAQPLEEYSTLVGQVDLKETSFMSQGRLNLLESIDNIRNKSLMIFCNK